MSLFFSSEGDYLLIPVSKNLLLSITSAFSINAFEASACPIVLTFNLFKSIKKNAENIFQACLDKNYLMWKELKKIELSERNNSGEIFIPDMNIKLKITRNPLKIIKN